MSEHHRTKQWAAVTRVWRPRFQAQINAGGMPCVNRCRMGGWVTAGQAWDVSHIVPVSAGGDDSPSNLGAAHKHCNRSDGGKDGARIANRTKTAQRAEDQRLFKW